MYRLTDTLPYMLYTISNHLADTFAAELDEHGLTISMYRVLAALFEKEDQRLNELSAMIYIETSTLSRLVGAMSARGLVSRRRQKDDERSVHINLTPAGRKLIDLLAPRAQSYEKLAVENLTRAEIASLKGALSRLLKNMTTLKQRATPAQNTSAKPIAKTRRTAAPKGASAAAR